MLKYTIDIYKDDDTGLWSATIDTPTDMFGVDRGLITQTIYLANDLELYQLNDKLIEWLGGTPENAG